MSSNSPNGQGQPPNGGNNNNNDRAKQTIVKAKNPYAKRKRPPTSSTSNANSNPQNKQQQRQPQPARPPTRSPVTGMEGSTGFSFSQAFGEIEDTEYYRTSVAEAPQNINHSQNGTATSVAATSEGAQQQRAQQRSFEEAAADAAGISDRDNHAFLQPHVLSVSSKQRGNGVLNYIRNVPYKHENIVPDYIMSTTSCALFLSCKYHALHPQYIHRRIAELKTDFKLRIMLVLVDVEDNMASLLFLNKLAVLHNFTLILAWTEEEAARYLESYKALDGNDASIIQRKEKDTFVDQASEFLSGATGVNKTDAASLLTQFTSVKAIMSASRYDLGLVNGLGHVKVKRLHDALHRPFSSKRKRERLKEKQENEAAEAKAVAAVATEDDSAALKEKDDGNEPHNDTAILEDKDDGNEPNDDAIPTSALKVEL